MKYIEFAIIRVVLHTSFTMLFDYIFKFFLLVVVISILDFARSL